MKERMSQDVHIHICNFGKRCLIINSNEQPDTSEIDPVVRSVVARD